MIRDYKLVSAENMCTLADLEQRLKQHVEPDKQESVSGFIAALKNGERYFELCVDGNIIDEAQKVQFSLIKGSAIYENVRWILNDTYGHMVGDEVIRKMASILEKEVGDHGVVGRIGGDEFLVIFYNVYNLENARELLRGIKNNVVTIFPPNNENKPVLSVFIGCAAYPKEAMINNISVIEAKDITTYNLMKKQGIISCIHIKFKDKNGADCVICFESVSKNIVWNCNHLHYYRLMARLLSNYVVVS